MNVETDPSQEAHAFIEALGREIAGQRTAAGHSLRDFSKLTGVSTESLHRYEHGKRDMPYGVLRKIGLALKIKPSALVAAAEARAERALAQGD